MQILQPIIVLRRCTIILLCNKTPNIFMKIADGMDDPGNDADDDDDVPDLVENFDECCKNEAKETIEKVEEVVEEVVATPAEGILL